MFAQNESQQRTNRPSFEERDVEDGRVLVEKLEHEYFECQMVLVFYLGPMRLPLGQCFSHPCIDLHKNILIMITIFGQGEHGVVVRAFGLYRGGIMFESLSTRHCWS